jgi:DNA-binding LytR/AlgR family response regulator
LCKEDGFFYAFNTVSLLKKKPVKMQYKEKWLWLGGYPAAALAFLFFANDNGFYKLIRLPSFIPDLIFALAVNYAVGIYISRLTLRLDKKMPWQEGFRKRLVRQILLGILLPLSLSMLAEMIYLRSIGIPLASSSMLNLELPLAFIFLTLINSFYLVNYLLYQKKTEVITVKEPVFVTAPRPMEAIVVQNGFKEERIGLDQCALITSSQKILWLYTFEGDRYRMQGTLEEWEEKLKEAGFYRVNRQYLAAAKAILSAEQTDTRKLKLHFCISLDEDVYVSKQNAASFRQWWKMEGPV